MVPDMPDWQRTVGAELAQIRKRYPPMWIVHGRRDGDSRVGMLLERRFDVEQEARTFITLERMQHGFRGVLVRLDHGEEINGERHVLWRTHEEAKAWWE